MPAGIRFPFDPACRVVQDSDSIGAAALSEELHCSGPIHGQVRGPSTGLPVT